eukprot:2304120-Amphidinium_carterae.2
MAGLGKAWAASMSCFTSGPEVKKVREGTLAAICNVLSWSLGALRTGMYPTHTLDGDPLDAGLGGQFLANDYLA